MTLNQLQQHIKQIIEYNWADELDDFRDNEEAPYSHIFRDLVAVDNFFNGTDDTPESYLKDAGSEEDSEEDEDE